MFFCRHPRTLTRRGLPLAFFEEAKKTTGDSTGKVAFIRKQKKTWHFPEKNGWEKWSRTSWNQKKKHEAAKINSWRNTCLASNDYSKEHSQLHSFIPSLKQRVRPWQNGGPQEERIVFQASIFRGEPVNLLVSGSTAPSWRITFWLTNLGHSTW